MPGSSGGTRSERELFVTLVTVTVPIVTTVTVTVSHCATQSHLRLHSSRFATNSSRFAPDQKVIS